MEERVTLDLCRSLEVGESSEELQERDCQGRRLHRLLALQGFVGAWKERSQGADGCSVFGDVDDQELAGSEMIINPLYQLMKILVALLLLTGIVFAVRPPAPLCRTVQIP